MKEVFQYVAAVIALTQKLYLRWKGNLYLNQLTSVHVSHFL